MSFPLKVAPVHMDLQPHLHCVSRKRPTFSLL